MLAVGMACDIIISTQNLIMEPKNGKPEFFLQNMKYLYGER